LPREARMPTFQHEPVPRATGGLSGEAAPASAAEDASPNSAAARRATPEAASGRQHTQIPCPLWAILTFTFIGSLGSGIVTNGIFFLAKHTYGFSDTQNYALGLLEGITYIVGALGAGPLIRRLRFAHGLSTRAALLSILLLLAAACTLPILARGAPAWPVWALMAVYAPVSGSLWPIVEAYVSGGRSGAALRSALGRFNITWSSATVVGYWVIGPLVEHRGALAIFLVALVHIASLAILRPLGPEPARHIHEEHEPHPPVYRQLLVTFRVLLPTSYLVVMALSPFLPTLMTRLQIETAWQTPLAAMWMVGRLFTFAVLERWHGWHGRWYPAIAGGALLLGGFALAVLCPLVSSGTVSIALMLGGLAGFGVGMATIYAAALYYAMEVGQAEVEAGGKHEALIGLGYTGGPSCGLVAVAAVRSGLIPTDSFEPAVLLLVGAVAAGAGAIAVYRSCQAGSGVRSGPAGP
jgi:MFS family permease